MRLLNTSTHRLEEFVANVPPYAILSHTWGEDEVLFSDMESGTAHEKKGFDKISKCCELAASEGQRYVWIDTCCINKSSSAELSEAINSMFEYYRRSQKCYVYLDVEIPDGNMTFQDLENARWTSRGWTLQELIAPRLVDFYDISWKRCGSRSSHHMELSQATRIPWSVLLDRDPFHSNSIVPKRIAEYSIAERMSWASRRNVTRPEDIAYCLLGIFNVHLPPLYGEGGENAFRRLQEEIMKTSTDLSILAWNSCPSWNDERRNVLANSPEDFDSIRDIAYIKDSSMEDFSLTNKGLRIKLPLIHEGNILEYTSTCTAILPTCCYGRSNNRLGLRLRDWELNVSFGEILPFRKIGGRRTWSKECSPPAYSSICVVEADAMADAEWTEIYLNTSDAL